MAAIVHPNDSDTGATLIQRQLRVALDNMPGALVYTDTKR